MEVAIGGDQTAEVSGTRAGVMSRLGVEVLNEMNGQLNGDGLAAGRRGPGGHGEVLRDCIVPVRIRYRYGKVREPRKGAPCICQPLPGPGGGCSVLEGRAWPLAGEGHVDDSCWRHAIGQLQALLGWHPFQRSGCGFGIQQLGFIHAEQDRVQPAPLLASAGSTTYRPALVAGILT